MHNIVRERERRCQGIFHAKISRRSKFEGDIKSFYRVQNFYEPVDKILIEPEVSLQMISS